MTFPEFLRAEVLRLGDGVSQRGEVLASIVLGTTDRTVRRWMAGETAPNKAEEVGARMLLPQAGALSERDKRLRRKTPARVEIGKIQPS
jgi:hypothetical protein